MLDERWVELHAHNVLAGNSHTSNKPGVRLASSKKFYKSAFSKLSIKKAYNFNVKDEKHLYIIRKA